MKKALKVKIIIGSLLVLVVLLCTTQPDKLPSLVLMVPFVLMYLVLWLGTTVAMGWFSGRASAKNVRRAAIGAALPIFLLVLQSIGQLTVRDILIIVALFGIAYFYMARMGASAAR